MNGPGAVGFVGLGRVGLPLACGLARAGYAVAVHDPATERVQAAVEAGGRAVAGPAEAARDAEALLCCLPDPDATAAAFEDDLLPAAASGQAFIDLGATGLEDTRRLHRLCGEKGVGFLDAPVCGDPDDKAGAAGAACLCVGGVRQVFERWEGLLQALAPAGAVLYCGPGGSGQAVRAARALALGIGAAGFLEALALARAAGVEPETVRRAVGDAGGWRGRFGAAAGAVADGAPEAAEAALGHWDGVLRDAAGYSLDLPLSAALAAALGGDGAAGASFWEELGRRRGEILKARYLGHGKAEGQKQD